MLTEIPLVKMKWYLSWGKYTLEFLDANLFVDESVLLNKEMLYGDDFIKNNKP